MAVQTVTGKVQADELGVTLTHEHLHMQFDVVFREPPARLKNVYPPEGKGGFNLQHLGILRQYPYSHSYNLKLDDKDTEAVIVDELLRYKLAGGNTLVENTVPGISRNIQLLQRLSRDSGIKIVAGTGFYVACAQPQSVLNYSVEQIHDLMMKELTEGVDDGIRCGIIGEIGCTWPLEDFERKVITAAAMIQNSANVPITFHAGRNPDSPFEIIRAFTEAGGKSEDVVMSHLDRTILDDEQLLEFAKFRTFTQFDLFGIECSYYQIQESVDMISDAERIRKLGMLKDEGRLNQILMSHDIHTKHRLVNFGGHGYGHILQNVVPKMKQRGFSDADITTITVDNPKRWLGRSKLI